MPVVEFRSGSSADGSPWWPNDTQCLADATSGVYAVVDAKGPTYGGRYRPVGVEVAWAALASTIREQHGSLLGAVVMGLSQANSAAFGVAPEWQALAASAIRTGTGTLIHPALSIALVAIRGNQLVAAGVGSCRVYLRRARKWSVIVPGQTLASAHSELSNELPTQVLGLQPSVRADSWSAVSEIDDLFVLCTAGAWGAADEIISSHVGLPDDPRDILAQLVTAGDSSACVLALGEGRPTGAVV